MRLWLLRHPETTAAAGACYGRSDVGVLPEHTRAVADRVAHLLPAGAPVVFSPLQRCAGLASAIAAMRPDLAMRPDARIAEMDFGDWEKGRWGDVDRAAFEAWTGDFADARAGASGESTRQFMHRVGAAFDDWRADGRDAVWVTHAGVIRAVWLLRDGLRCVERAEQWPSRAIAYGEWLSVEMG